MKFFNVAMALALVLAPDTAFAMKESNTFLAATSDDNQPTFPHQYGLEETISTASSKGTRNIVKYNDNSPIYNAKLETARIQAEANKKQGGKDLNGAVPSFSADTHLLTHGRFLPNQNIEIVYFHSEEEKTLFGQSEEVEYIEEDSKFFMNAEQIPYGIDTVQALAVSDDNVSNLKVCILDTGYDITHPDLTSDTNIVTGYAGSNSAGPRPWTYDGHGHGTHVAGTIAAIGSNDKGVVGVNRNGQLKLHIVKVFGDNGAWGWQSTLIAAGEECVNANANVISMSLGGSGSSQAASDAYDRMLNDDNILIVAAAGNGGKNAAKSYPASYESVMSVAATDINDNVAGFSQENDQVDIAAPGVYVLSTLPLHVASSGYSAWSGTSMACPHVSGVAALVWSHHPTKSAVEIRQALEGSAVDMGATGRDDAYGHGLLRADLAMEFLGGSPSISSPPTSIESPSSSPIVSPSSSPVVEACSEDPKTSFFFEWRGRELTKTCLWLDTKATTGRRNVACAMEIDPGNDLPVASVACPETCDTCPKDPSSQPTPSPTISFAPTVQGDCSQKGSSEYLNSVNSAGRKIWKTCNDLSAMPKGKIRALCLRDYNDGNEAKNVCRVTCGTCPSECELRVMELEDLNAELQKRIDDLEKK